ncbi:hypothetical protein ACWCPF_29485 [Streptomyces sp. NPDC001858]
MRRGVDHARGSPFGPRRAYQHRGLRVQVEHIASHFPEFTIEHVFARYFEGPHRAPDVADADAAEAEADSLVRRLRPLGRQPLDA